MRAVAVVATAVLALFTLASSRFAPEALDPLNQWLPDTLRTDWFHRLLAPEWRVYSILLWVLAVFALLSLLDRLVKGFGAQEASSKGSSTGSDLKN